MRIKGAEKDVAARAAASLAAALLLAAGPAGAAFEDLGAGARAPGMGGAFTALADDIYAIYYNPAGLALLGRPELAASHTQHLTGLSDGSGISTSFLGFARPLEAGGTIGGALQNFSVDGSFYGERALYLSYGRASPESLGLDGLYWGLNLKNLRRAFGSLPEASSARSGLTSTGRPDPVLSGRSAVSVFDADLGLLYKYGGNYSAGLQLLHLNRPDIAFSQSGDDKLPLNAKLGLAYSGMFSNITTQYETSESPYGSRDNRFTIALERWFPWLLVGNIGARGSLSIGSREFRQTTAGFSYRSGRISVDYGFVMPIGTLTGTSGSHRFSFSVRFGPPKEDEESAQLVLAAMRSIKTGRTPEIKPPADASPQTAAALADILGRTRFLEAEGRYPEAAEELSKAIALNPQDPRLLKRNGRLSFVAVHLGRLADYRTDAVQSALYRSAIAYLNDSDDEAVNQAAYALGLRPGANSVGNYLAQLELTTGLKARKLDLAPETALKVDNLLSMASEALEASRYEEAIVISEAALKHQPGSISALENLGISHFATGDNQKSLEAWKKARALETSRARLAMLNAQIASVENVIRQQSRNQKLPPAPAARQAKPEAPKADAAQVQKLYREGLHLYSSGELEKARAVFRNALKLDPAHTPSSNAIKRINRELGN